MTPPYRIFGMTMAACHGMPALVSALILSVSITAIAEVASQVVKPVTLDSVWVEPRAVTAAQILNQQPDKPATEFYKSGSWRRLCAVTARQTFSDEHGITVLQGEYHTVDTPKATGRFFSKHRGLQIPKLLANQPGIWKVKIENSGVCWLLERAIPIDGMVAEATFEIVP